ncbi:MAG: ligase-associated DNA damage response DEXH box helicase [Pseudomonadota bacterium]
MSSNAMQKVEQYFTDKGWDIFDFQRETWLHYLQGDSGLNHSPTGMGKTLAAWFGPIMEYMQANSDSEKTVPLTVLWITPLRALASDTENSLLEVVNELSIPWTVERRTGDTSAALRAKQKKCLPSCLITTPESLSLLLTYKDMTRKFKHLRCIVVDEWHELLGTKRGVQLELCLSHLRKINPQIRTWGLSATIGNVDQAMQVLLGPNEKGVLIKAKQEKTVQVKSLIPDMIEQFPWGGHLGIKLLPQVVNAIEQANSTLLFTNTRSQAEIWFESIIKARPEWQESLAIHHGSLNRDVRLLAEQGLRNGHIICVVCTSSLDLGVDFSPVDLVIQVGSAKGVARLLQRAGRSGHRPGIPSKIYCVPTNAFELVEIAAVRYAIEQGRIEQRRPLTNCLDVLVQHCVTLALGEGFKADALLSEVKASYAYQDLSENEWQWVLDFITRGGEALQHYPQYQKVVNKNGLHQIENKRIAQHHRMSIGTITSDTSMQVKYLKGGRLGSIEESFIAKLNPGDAFLFNGKVLSLVQVKDMTAYVKVAKNKTRIVPRWQGGRLPLSTELAVSVREMLDPKINVDETHELEKISELLSIQRQWSALPEPNQLLIETIKTREGYHLYCYPFAGRLAHEGLAALIAWRYSKLVSATCTTSTNDYGLELLSNKPIPADEKTLLALLSPENVTADLLNGINESEMSRRQFRDIARISGLVFQGFPGSGKSTRQIQASSGLIYDVLQKYDSNNKLLSQSLHEVLEHQIEQHRLLECLHQIQEQTLELRHPERLTPFAFPIWAERLRAQIISSEKWQERVKRMAEQLEREVGKNQQTIQSEIAC